MALTKQQELDIAYQRKVAGTASSTDIKNLDYAQSKGIWNPPSGRNLEGTMNNTSPSPTPISDEARSLPNTTSSFANLRSLLTKAVRGAVAEGPSAEDYLKIYADKGIPLTDPSTISSALERGTISRASMVGDVYKSSLDLINEQEKRQNDYLSAVMSGLPKAFLAQMSGKDFDEIKSGNVSPELKKRIEEFEIQKNKTPLTKTIKGKLYEYNQITGKWEEVQLNTSNNVPVNNIPSSNFPFPANIPSLVKPTKTTKKSISGTQLNFEDF